MIVAEELNHDFNLMRLIPNDTDITPNQGSTSVAQPIQTARQVGAGSGRGRLSGAPRHGLDPARRADREPDRLEGRRLAAAAAPSRMPRSLGGKLFNVQAPASYNLTATTAEPAGGRCGPCSGLPGADEAREPVHAHRQGTRPAADRHPVEGHGHLHVRPQHPGSRDGPRPDRPASRARAPTATARTRRCSRSTRARSATSRTRRSLQKGNFVGVVAPQEYDAIQAAAQLKVTWARDARAPPGSGNLWKQMRTQDAQGLAPATIKTLRGNVDSAIAGAAKTVSQTYTYPYNGHLPIGPDCCVAEVDGERRPDLLEHAERVRDPHERGRDSRVRVVQPGARQLLRGLERLRLRALRRPRTVGGGDVAARRRAGAAPVHALGRARLRQLRAGDDVRHSPRRGFHGEARRLGRRRVRPAVLHDDARDGVDGHDEPGVRRGDVGRHDERRDAVQPPGVEGDRQVGAAPEQLLQDLVLEGPAGAADLLRLRAGDRRARLRGEDGSVHVPAEQHRDARERRGDGPPRSHLGPLAERADARRSDVELEAEGRELGRSRPATSSPDAGSRSGRMRAR